MRLYDIICDKVLNSRLFEMALQRRDAINKIRDLADPLSDHLIKFYAFDDEAKNHWANEINSYLFKINKIHIKPNSKKLQGDMYYSLLWDEPLNNGVQYITSAIAMFQANGYENCVRTNLTDAQIYEQCEKILHIISYDIANNKFISFKNYIQP